MNARSVLLVVVIVAVPARADDAADKLLVTFVDEFVHITPGDETFPKSFEMGSKAGSKTEQPAHAVTFDYSFHIAKYEVPQNLYAAVMGHNPSRWQGPRNAAEMMTHADAVRFCERITKLLRTRQLMGADEEIRLPTEAEWEYCCRAGTTTAYSFGDSARMPGDTGRQASRLDKYAWHTGNSAGNDPPVGALLPNAWGLYDMHGYLGEYCADDWHGDYNGAPADGSAWMGDAVERKVVVRGGSWQDGFGELRSATRKGVAVTTKDAGVGFRCVRAVTE